MCARRCSNTLAVLFEHLSQEVFKHLSDSVQCSNRVSMSLPNCSGWTSAANKKVSQQRSAMSCTAGMASPGVLIGFMAKPWQTLLLAASATAKKDLIATAVRGRELVGKRRPQRPDRRGDDEIATEILQAD